MRPLASIAVLFLLLHATQLFSQANDSLKVPANNTLTTVDSTAISKAAKKKIYSGPRKATILSAVLPGLGQAYNKKYWKIPVIYAAIGGLGYMFSVNNNQYHFYRSNLIAANDDDVNTLNATRYSSDQLQQQKIFYRKNRDFAAIGLALVYLFNVIDANVDAHLKTFDVSDDLSINLDHWENFVKSPSGFGTAAGLSIKLNFK